MSAHRSVTVYRRLAAMYPKSFRDEYGDDLVAAFTQQLHDEGTARAWVSTVRDLLATIPSQHLEVRMKRPRPNTVAVLAISVAVAALVLAFVVGSGPVVGVFILVAVAALAVAVLAWKAARPAGFISAREAARWRTYVIVGLSLLTVTIVTINVPPYNDKELPEAGWALMMLSLLTSVVLITLGLTIGIARRSTQHAPTS